MYDIQPAVSSKDLHKPSTDQIEESNIDGRGQHERLEKIPIRDLETANNVSSPIPQPSDDPNDPLNWSQTRKNIILIVISFAGINPRICFKPLLKY
jgi:hypothetical protein